MLPIPQWGRAMQYDFRRQQRVGLSSAVTRMIGLPLLSLLLLALMLSNAIVAYGQQHQLLATSSAGASAYTSNSLCPRCPLCSRPGTPMKQQLQYCYATSSYIFSLFAWGKSALVTTPHNRDSTRQQRKRYPLELPFSTDDAVRRQCMRDVQDLLFARVRGQPQVITPLLDVLRRKLAYPREPVVVHLAGDNGVGKTYTARLVSQALSLRCASDRDVCDAGDNLLTVAGSGFDGLSVAEARQRIVGQIVDHIDRYPHGVVLIDDLTAMDPALVTALAPLFGRASYFPEQLARFGITAASARHEEGRTQQQDVHSSTDTVGGHVRRGSAAGDEGESGDAVVNVDGASTSRRGMHTFNTPIEQQRQQQHPSSSLPSPLSQLLVFITTDFGRQGRTVGKSRTEIEAMIQEDFADLYGALLPAYTRTFIYYPFTSAMAEDVVRSAVTDLPCTLGEHLIASSLISNEAVSYLVQQHRQLWSGKENGHALRRVIEDELVSQLIVYWEMHEQEKHFKRLRVLFDLDEASMRVVLRTPGRSSTTVSQPPEVPPSAEARARVCGGGGGESEDCSDL